MGATGRGAGSGTATARGTGNATGRGKGIMQRHTPETGQLRGPGAETENVKESIENAAARIVRRGSPFELVPSLQKFLMPGLSSAPSPDIMTNAIAKETANAKGKGKEILQQGGSQNGKESVIEKDVRRGNLLIEALHATSTTFQTNVDSGPLAPLLLCFTLPHFSPPSPPPLFFFFLIFCRIIVHLFSVLPLTVDYV